MDNKCDQCNKSFTRSDNLARHKARSCHVNKPTGVVITCEKKPGDKRPACDEIIHFDSDEFEHGVPKSIETLKKLGSLVNKEVPPEKRIPIIANKPPSQEDVDEIFKPIDPPIKDDKQNSDDDETDMETDEDEDSTDGEDTDEDS